jgi:hypothetical protein
VGFAWGTEKTLWMWLFWEVNGIVFFQAVLCTKVLAVSA